MFVVHSSKYYRQFFAYWCSNHCVPTKLAALNTNEVLKILSSIYFSYDVQSRQSADFYPFKIMLCGRQYVIVD